MVITGTARASHQGRWPATKTQPPRDPQRHLLCRSPVGVPGNCFLMTFRLGAPFITISGSDAAPEFGSRSMTGCGNRCGRQRVATPTRVPRFWIVNPYARARREVCAATTLARRSGGANAIFWSISSACCTGRGHGGQQAGPERSITLVGASGKTVPARAPDLGRWVCKRLPLMQAKTNRHPHSAL
jgi:hypothetical protein